MGHRFRTRLGNDSLDEAQGQSTQSHADEARKKRVCCWLASLAWADAGVGIGLEWLGAWVEGIPLSEWKSSKLPMACFLKSDDAIFKIFKNFKDDFTFFLHTRVPKKSNLSISKILRSQKE